MQSEEEGSHREDPAKDGAVWSLEGDGALAEDSQLGPLPRGPRRQGLGKAQGRGRRKLAAGAQPLPCAHRHLCSQAV